MILTLLRNSDKAYHKQVDQQHDKDVAHIENEVSRRVAQVNHVLIYNPRRVARIELEQLRDVRRKVDNLESNHAQQAFEEDQRLWRDLYVYDQQMQHYLQLGHYCKKFL